MNLVQIMGTLLVHFMDGTGVELTIDFGPFIINQIGLVVCIISMIKLYKYLSSLLVYWLNTLIATKTYHYVTKLL